MRETTRRALLSRASVALPAVALPAALAAATPADPDPHPAWLAGVLARRDLINARPGGLGDEAVELLFDEELALEDRLYLTPARTLAGVRAQLAGVVEAIDHSAFGEAEEAGLRTALATLERLSGEAAHAP